MKRFFTILLFAAAFAGTLNAQRRATVSGVVADADTRQSLTGALVGMAPATDTTNVTHLVSGAGGTFSTGLAQGEYIFEVSLLGYESTRRTVEVDATRVTVDTLFLRQGIMIDDVVKTAVAMRTSLQGDTIIYNADSYKVAADADVSGLLQKMPGIKVENGAVEAQGEEVKKILIEGREFFGEDVNAAITSLPAEVVKSIEVFDKLSDNAEFTGIDDGEGYKAINIRTRESMRQGIMGKVFATYGAEPADKGDDSWHHYGLVSGNVNIFQGDAKISLGGTFNNLNERNFTSDDFLGAGGGDGIAKVGVFQANYIDTWGKKKDWQIDATYRYNYTDSENEQFRETEYFDLTLPYPYVDSYNFSNQRNNNHVFRARIDYKPNSFQELRIRPFIRYQGNRGHANGWQSFMPSDIMDPSIDYDNWSNSKNTGWNVGMDINYRIRINKPGRTMAFRLNGGYNSNDRNGENYTENYESGVIIPELKRSPTDNYSYNIRGGVIYTEPVSKSSLITLDYSFSYQYSDIDRKTYYYDYTLDQYEREYRNIGSGIYNSEYWTHRVGPGYRMQKSETTLFVGVFFEYATLTSESVAPVRDPLKSDYYNPTYSVMLTSKFRKNASLRIFMNSSTGSPAVENLQDVINVTDIQNLSIGNPDLKLTYMHRMHARLILPNVEKGRTFSLHLFGTYGQNYVSNMTLRNGQGYVITDGQGNTETISSSTQTFTRPVNLDGYWQVRLGADYGFPLNFMKSNLNLRLGTSYQETPSLTGSLSTNGMDIVTTKNNSRNAGVDGGLVLGSNISERVDFTVGYNVGYNNVWNTELTEGDNAYLRHTLNANFKVVLPAYFTISGDAYFTSYDVLKGRSFNQQYVLVNASIGKKIFRSKQWEVNLYCNDIFNQNTNFMRQWNADNMANITNHVIGRYFGVKMTWNIRKFGKNGSQNPAMYENTDTERRPDGPPPGGMPGGARPPMGGGGFRGGGF